MRRTIAATIIALTLAACSPYDTPADAAPDQAITTSAVKSAPPMLYSAPACDRACWTAVVERQKAERAWWAEVVRQQQARAAWARLTANLEAQRRATTGRCYIEGIRVCDGPGLLPHHIVWRESRMNPRARNPHSSAGGYAQLLIGTMRSVCPAEAARYGNAAYAPVAVQVECVRRLIALHGLRPWRL